MEAASAGGVRTLAAFLDKPKDSSATDTITMPSKDKPVKPPADPSLSHKDDFKLAGISGSGIYKKTPNIDADSYAERQHKMEDPEFAMSPEEQAQYNEAQLQHKPTGVGRGGSTGPGSRSGGKFARLERSVSILDEVLSKAAYTKHDGSFDDKRFGETRRDAYHTALLANDMMDYENPDVFGHHGKPRYDRVLTDDKYSVDDGKLLNHSLGRVYDTVKDFLKDPKDTDNLAAVHGMLNPEGHDDHFNTNNVVSHVKGARDTFSGLRKLKGTGTNVSEAMEAAHGRNTAVLRKIKDNLAGDKDATTQLDHAIGLQEWAGDSHNKRHTEGDTDVHPLIQHLGRSSIANGFVNTHAGDWYHKQSANEGSRPINATTFVKDHGQHAGEHLFGDKGSDTLSSVFGEAPGHISPIEDPKTDTKPPSEEADSSVTEAQGPLPKSMAFKSANILSQYLGKAQVAPLPEQEAAVQEDQDMSTDHGSESGGPTPDLPEVGVDWDANKDLAQQVAEATGDQKLADQVASKQAVRQIFGEENPEISESPYEGEQEADMFQDQAGVSDQEDPDMYQDPGDESGMPPTPEQDPGYPEIRPEEQKSYLARSASSIVNKYLGKSEPKSALDILKSLD
jgi:hypothetical protein